MICTKGVYGDQEDVGERALFFRSLDPGLLIVGFLPPHTARPRDNTWNQEGEEDSQTKESAVGGVDRTCHIQELLLSCRG